MIGNTLLILFTCHVMLVNTYSVSLHHLNPFPRAGVFLPVRVM